MSASAEITAIILTFNEEHHIARCIESLRSVVTRIIVIDSFSTDCTVEIAHRLGAEVLQNTWKNYATQFQWGMEQADISTGWTMRMDADEYLESELQSSILAFLRAPGAHNAVYLRRKICFLDRPIKHGFFYPAMMLRIWRTGEGKIEQRWMDEHIQVHNPVTISLTGDLVDHNLNDLAWWTNKHVGYARREAYDIIASRAQAESSPTYQLSGTARRKRFLKNKIYNHLPSALRSTLYFLYRYIFGLGFLDGKEGFFFHFLQAYWYRTYVDASLFEIERKAAVQGVSAYEMLRRDGIF